MNSNYKNLYTSNNPPIQATLMRGSNIESIHKIHAVITDKKGRVLMCAGNPESFHGLKQKSHSFLY